MKKWWNKQLILSLFFFALFIAAIVINELDLFKKMTATPVVMANQEIDKDMIITNDMVFIYEMPHEIVTENMYTNLQDVIGKTTTKLILPNEFISDQDLDTSLLRPTAEHEFFPIPNDWLVDIQGTLRRYDLVNISTISDKDRQPESIEEIVVVRPEEPDKSKEEADFVLRDVPVAYVKDSRNMEVRGASSNDDRINGSTKPSNIQLSLTLEQFKQLEQLVLDGYRLVLSY